MWALLLMGFLGSLHCVGMCGPLAILIHQQSRSRQRYPWQGMVLYHLGRISTYMLLGLLVGLLSTSLWGHLQFYLALVAGLILIMASFSLLPWERQIWALPGMRWLGERIPRYYAHFMQLPAFWAPAAGGMVNGLLPCGLVYLALSAALVTGDPWLSVSLMGMFGLGTVPALAITQLAGWKVQGKLGWVRRYVLPVFLLLTGGFLLLRAFAVPVPADLRLLLEMTHIPMCHD